MGCGACGQKSQPAHPVRPYTIVDVVKDVATGNVVKVDDETRLKRLLICHGGEHEGQEVEKCVHERGPLCGMCGCVIKLKVEFSKSSCPVNKW